MICLGCREQGLLRADHTGKEVFKVHTAEVQQAAVSAQSIAVGFC